MAEWKDISSYSRGEKDRTPNCFELNVGGYRLVIMTNHLCNKGAWTLCFIPFTNTNTSALQGISINDVEAAKEHAIRFARAMVSAILEALPEVKNG
jgi:hypothetical protein